MFTDAVILIAGGTGSWGQELVRQLLSVYSPKDIRILSRSEQRQVEMKRQFQDSRISYYIGDVRDKERLTLVCHDVDFIFHLAALKHVPVCEENPWEATMTNIVGTQNIIEAATKNRVKRVIYVSTDKAVEPFNLYGVTKACAEKLIIAANLSSECTKFVCIRAGNVIGTSGSVIPLFREQLLKANAITLTDERMTRFFMRISDAVKLLMDAAVDSVGGEILVVKMPACSIRTLAEIMIRRLGNAKTEIRIIGIRPGEKLYEVLVSNYEIMRTIHLEKYFVILPQIKIHDVESAYLERALPAASLDEFNSNNAVPIDAPTLEEIIERDGWFDVSLDSDTARYLQGLDSEKLLKFFQTENWT